MIIVQNASNGLFRASHSHNPPQYSHSRVASPHFMRTCALYGYIGACNKSIPPLSCKHDVWDGFLHWNHI